MLIPKATLADLLHKANASPPTSLNGMRAAFYDLKDDILRRYGTEDGHDIQHINGKRCFKCHGTGIYECWFDDDEPCSDYCWKCDGTGWYKREKWVTLKRYRFGPYVFHRPDGVSYQKPEPDVTRIEGYVEHSNYPGRTSENAAITLCLLFGRWKAVWNMLTDGRPCGWCLHPYQIASQILCPIVWRLRDWRREWQYRKQRRATQEQQQFDQDIPF